MKKPNRLYRLYFYSNVRHRRYNGWLYDTVEVPLDRKKFRRQFKFVRIRWYCTVALLFIPFCIWYPIGPYWKRYD